MQSLTKSQVKWASSHDWFVSSQQLVGLDHTSNSFKVIVLDDGIELGFYNFDDLKSWAGY